MYSRVYKNYKGREESMELNFVDVLKKKANQKLFEMEERFQTQFEKLLPPFQTNFKKISQNIVALQKKKELGSIAYLEYTMLYTNVLQKKYIAEIRVYDDMWYLDNCQMTVGTMDLSDYFQLMDKLQEQLLKERKRYQNMISKTELLEYLVPYFLSFYEYFRVVCRFGILKCLEFEEFKNIKKCEQFEINVGTYMADAVPIYKENKNKSSEDALIEFQDRAKFQYAFEDFADLDFSGADLSEIDLRYADLRRTNLQNTNLQDALLVSTRLCDCNLENADLRYSYMNEADFTNSNLKNANLSYAAGDSGWDKSEEWEAVGFRGISFRNANLQNADFRKTSFLGADFTGADLTGSIWNQAHLAFMNFSEEQKKSIIIR